MINLYKNKKAFTLLEIIIVIIIIGVLASLALPRYIKTVEYARGMEALMTVGILRQAINRYYIPKNSYAGVTLDNLDLENPNTEPRRHFQYEVNLLGQTGPGDFFEIKATRNTFDNSNPPTPGDIIMKDDGVKSGTGTYSGIR